MNTTSVHPGVVYDGILANASHPAKRRNLTLIHTVCKEREKLGSKDFSLKAVGEAVEALGGPKVKVLWNLQSADYRKLIEAWHAYSGSPKLPESAKAGKEEVVTRNISDPATRIVVEQLIREKNSLRAEVNILKANAKVVIDKRPNAGRVGTADGAMTLEISAGPKFNALEQEALEHAISPEFWRTEGWKEEKNGRVVKELGEGRTRSIFKPGFVSAIRKCIDKK